MRALILSLCFVLAGSVLPEPNPGKSQPIVEFLMFDGCPNSPKMKANLQTAMKSFRPPLRLRVIDILKLPAGDIRKGYGAPSVLVNDKDLFGLGAPKPSQAMPSCRLYIEGIPSAASIKKHLRSMLANK